MRKLRGILNIKWTDKCTNNSVYQQTKIPSLESLIIKNRVCWSGHVVRMKGHRLPEQILYGELQIGKRLQGGQRKRFKDCLEDSMKRSHIRTETWVWNAARKTRWMSMVHKGMQIFEEERMQHRDKLRAGRKIGSTDTPSDDLKCFRCDRICRPLIGLRSHQATENSCRQTSYFT